MLYKYTLLFQNIQMQLAIFYKIRNNILQKWFTSP